MKTITEDTFKNKLFSIFSELEISGEDVSVMVDGQVAIRLVAYWKDVVSDGNDMGLSPMLLN